MPRITGAVNTAKCTAAAWMWRLTRVACRAPRWESAHDASASSGRARGPAGSAQGCGRRPGEARRSEVLGEAQSAVLTALQVAPELARAWAPVYSSPSFLRSRGYAARAPRPPRANDYLHGAEIEANILPTSYKPAGSRVRVLHVTGWFSLGFPCKMLTGANILLACASNTGVRDQVSGVRAPHPQAPDP